MIMLYPLTFKPILKSVIWGGSRICPFKGITPTQDGIGESWELSHVDGNFSIVAEGELANKSLDELIKTYGKELVGGKVMERFGSRFPLLIKFIDAHDNLSIQVHPNDELAKARHNSFGKTEMWYVIKADKGAFLYSGFSQQIDKDEYVKRVADNTIMDVLKKYDVSEGDVFFLPASMQSAQVVSSQKSSKPAISLTASTTTTAGTKTAICANCIQNWQKTPLTTRCTLITAPITKRKPTRRSTWQIANISRPT